MSVSTGTVPLFIRLDGRHIQVVANLNWSIYQLKQHLLLHCNKSADDLRIIFAGSELENTALLKNCQLSGGTIVHVINVSSVDSNHKKLDNTSAHHSTNLMAPTSSGISMTSQHVTSSQRREKFYIYCKSLCHDIKPGKLRVRCRQCKDEAFELNSGPNSWNDVLNSNTIKGRCNSSNNQCPGEFAEFYFRCSEHENTVLEERQSVIQLQLFRTNIQDVSCLACTDVCDVVLVFPCPDSHVICVDCFKMYCLSKLNSREFMLQNDIGYTLPCPGLGDSCPSTFLSEIHHFLLLGQTQYERFKNFATEEFVLQNGGILCPAENCGNGLLIDNDVRKVTCRVSSGGCGFVFCRTCKLQYHESPCNNNNGEDIRDNNSSDHVAGNRDNTSYAGVSEENSIVARWRDDRSSMCTINRTTKACPGCKVPTEKSGGCNHMVCVRCRLEWCWLCLVVWGRNCEADHWFRAS